MKIHAVIRAFEVESRTRDGWTLVQAMHASQYEKVFCETPIAIEGYDGHSSSYGSAGSLQQARREELVQVHEPVFLVAKELEAIDREEQIKKELREAQDKLKLAEEKHKLDARDLEIQKNKIQGLDSDLSNLRTSLSDERTTRQRMEAQLTKIRSAIGTVRYDEIVGV
jgi:predicted GIY-YIG superfamily endonuclease